VRPSLSTVAVISPRSTLATSTNWGLGPMTRASATSVAIPDTAVMALRLIAIFIG